MYKKFLFSSESKRSTLTSFFERQERKNCVYSILYKITQEGNLTNILFREITSFINDHESRAIRRMSVPVVVVPKRSGRIRICADLSALCYDVQLKHFQMPTVDH